MFGHLYLGIAEGALETARDYTLTTSRPWALGGHATVTDEPYVLAAYGDHVARLAAVGALAGKIAEDLSDAVAKGHALTWEERGELAVEVAKLKVVATDTALDITSGPGPGRAAGAGSGRSCRPGAAFRGGEPGVAVAAQH